MMNKIEYEYAIIRLVPVIEREEFINVGVLLMSKRKRFIQVRTELNEFRIKALFPSIDFEDIKCQLPLFERIALGIPGSGLIATLPLHERFRWLTANRSTLLQTSRVHGGITDDLDFVFNKLYEEYVII